LEAAREAESAAKRVAGKAAVCVHLLKRSGEPLEMTSKWQDENGLLDVLAEHFASEAISSKLAYDVMRDAYAGAALEMEPQTALLKRLLERHSDPKASPSELLKQMKPWLEKIGLAELGKWLALARFVAQGGDE